MEHKDWTSVRIVGERLRARLYEVHGDLRRRIFGVPADLQIVFN